MIAYDNAFIAERDEIGKLELAEEKGELKKTIKVIEKCLKRKMSLEDIADITDLTIEEVTQIIEKYIEK